MAERLVAWAGNLQRWWSARQHHTGLRLLRIALAVGVLVACGWFIWQQVSRGYTAISLTDLTLAPGRLVVSWLCITAATALGAWEWVLLARALGAEMDTVGGMSVHLTANLGKYLPGMIWPFAGKAYLANRRGVPLRLASASIGAELAIIYSAGGLLALLCLPFSGLLPWSLAPRIALQAGVIALTIISILAVPAVGARALARLGRWPRVDWWQVSLVLALVLLTWCLIGFGFSTLYGPPASGVAQHLLRHSLALALALVLGQVAFFLPTGVGVREAVLVALLSTPDTAGRVVILAIAFRLLMMVGEILCAAVMVAWDRISRRREAGLGN
jgi:hypothetical protein